MNSMLFDYYGNVSYAPEYDDDEEFDQYDYFDEDAHKY